MPLEDLTGAKYINALNRDWPLGTDLPDAGDDHVRGMKNVTLNTFPNVTGPVSLTQDQINRGSVPVGTRALFYQAAAPDGWERVAGILDTSMLRLVTSAAVGGVGGGVDDPTLNDKIPTHNHSVPAQNTTNESTAHTHNVDITAAGAHSHRTNNGAGFNSNKTNGGVAGTESKVSAYNDSNVVGDHTHTVTVGNETAAHNHNVPVHDTLDNVGGSTWQPRYADIILCERSALA